MGFLQYLINGISIGAVYAIIALGYTMVYGIAKMLNFAHGDVIMVGAYMSYSMTAYLGMPAYVGVLVAIVVCTLQNTHNVLTDLLHFKSTYIHMHLLEVIPAEEVAAANTVDIAHKVYDLMAADLGPENVLECPEENA